MCFGNDCNDLDATVEGLDADGLATPPVMVTAMMRIQQSSLVMSMVMV